MRLLITLLLAASLTLTGCAMTSTTQSGSVGADREQLLLISAKEMNAGANKAYDQVLAEARANGGLNSNAEQTERVRAIAARLIPHTKVFRKDAPDWDWEVNVLTVDQLNAWCMPGGKIAFYTGIIEGLKLSDDEIAAIMGHEIAHALREHSRERASEQMATQLGLSVLSEAFGLSTNTQQLAGVVSKYTLELPNSRQHETEADRIGVELAARAGYNPYAAVDVWKKMSKLSTGSIPEIMSTHPSNSSRIKDLKKYASKVQPLYQAAIDA